MVVVNSPTKTVPSVEQIMLATHTAACDNLHRKLDAKQLAVMQLQIYHLVVRGQTLSAQLTLVLRAMHPVMQGRMLF